MKWFVASGDREREVRLESTTEGALVAHVDGRAHVVDVAGTADGGLLHILVDGASFAVAVRFEDGHAVLNFHDREVRVRVEDERERQTRLLVGQGRTAPRGAKIKSVMPGVVKELRVAVGAHVVAGAPLLILEAMKMENEIRAPIDGRVERIHVAAGAAVEKGAALVDLAPPTEEAARS